MTLTERVYTHLDVRILIDAVNKIVEDRENGKEGIKTEKSRYQEYKNLTRICFSYTSLFHQKSDHIVAVIFAAYVMHTRYISTKFHHVSEHLTGMHG